MTIQVSEKTIAHSAVNREVAEKLQLAAGLLQQQKANPYRVRAYRRARRAERRRHGKAWTPRRSPRGSRTETECLDLYSAKGAQD